MQLATTMGFVLGKLAEMLFAREDVEKKIENLSGGEAARLVMVKLAVMNPNVLVLDEPNNPGLPVPSLYKCAHGRPQCYTQATDIYVCTHIRRTNAWPHAHKHR